MEQKHHNDHSLSNIKTAFLLNFFFTIVELVGGYFTNSVAILSDALHDLGDSLSLGLAWYFQKVSKKGRDHKFSYGYKRFSLLGAIINSIVLTAGSIYILTQTIPRLISPEPANATGMIWLAILGMIVNGAAVFKLRKGHSVNERVVSLHLLEDVLGWAAVLIGAILMYFFDWPIIDPLLSVGITIFILYHVWKNIRKTFKIILQGIPEETNSAEIESYLKTYMEVSGIHDLHIWTIDGEYNILSVHLVVEKDISIDKIQQLKSQVRDGLKEFGINHSTLEFETVDEKCLLEEC